MEEQKKSRKPLLVGVIAAVVVLAALLALLLTQCVGGTGPSDTSGADTTAPATQGYDLYWNVDRNNFEVIDGESTTGRKPADDGYYHMVFAHEGKQVELRVKERRLVNIIDAYDLMQLVFDENGDIIDIVRLDDLPLQKLTWQYYIQSFGGNAVKLNSSKDMNGMEEMVKTADDVVIYDVSGWSEYVGAPGKLQKNDRAYVIANEEGLVTHIFLFERDGIEKTIRAECKHCGEEVTWQNWLRTDILPTSGGHYFLELDMEIKKQNQVQGDQIVCLDLNGYTIHSSQTARIYSTWGAGCELNIMDNSEGAAGKIDLDGKNMDQGGALWARYGNINIYDITIDASDATTRIGGTTVCVEGGVKVTLHSGTLIGGKTVEVKGQSSPQQGATVRVGSKGKFVMNGGLVTGGESSKTGANVYISSDGTFEMNGGKITNGRAKGANGGNVAVAKNGTFTMNGGTISGGRAYRNDKNVNGAGANVYINGTFTMNSGTITGGRCYQYDGTLLENVANQNMFIVNGDLYMYGGRITGYVQATDTNVNDTDKCIVYVSGGARISGAAEGGTNLTLGKTAVFQAGRLSGKAEIYVTASGVFSEKTRESNVNYVHSDDPAVSVTYYNECLALGRAQCICGASLTEGKAHVGPCDGTIEFFGPFSTGITKNVSGNYYLTKDFENLSQQNFGTANSKDEKGNTIVADPITINLDLNGHSMHSNGRVMLVNANATVNIADSVGGGVLSGKGSNGAPNAGVALISGGGATVNVLGDLTLKGEDLYESMKVGGVFTVSGTLNMYHGTIEGAEGLENGSAVYLYSNGVMNMYNDSKIVGGTTTKGGGSVYMSTSSKLTMSGDSKIVDGQITGSASSDSHGGNVYILKNSTLTMKDNASISGGTALNTFTYVDADGKTVQRTAFGGNIYSQGIIEMYDNASITDGKSESGTADKEATNKGINCNMFLVGANASLKMYGGHIDVVNISSSIGKFIVGGNARVDNLKLAAGKSIEIVGVLTDEAKIVLNAPSGGVFTNETVAENADNFSTSDNQKIVFYAKDKKLYIGGEPRDYNPVHCVCGAAVGDVDTNSVEHANGCDKQIVTWIPYTGQTTTGNYYLIANMSGSSKAIGANQNVKIDLNGYNITSSSRAFQATAEGATLWLCNTAPKMEGMGIVSGKSTYWENKPTQGGVIWFNKGEFNLIGNVTLKASDAFEDRELNYGGIVALEGTASFNMYDGEIIGTTVNTRGGAVSLSSTSSFTMHGGKVIGGTAKTDGGAISVNATTAKFTMEGGEIVGGKAANGSAISGNGTMVIKNAVIDGGVIDRDTEAHSGGRGALYITGGTWTLDNTVVNGAYVDELDSSDDGTYGGSAIYTTAGTVNVINGSVLNGYTEAHSNIRRGGTVYITGSTNFTLNNSTITGSKVQVNGAAVQQAGGTFTMTGENAAIDASKATTGIESLTYGGAVTMSGGTFNLEAGTITGNKVTYTTAGGAVAVTGSSCTFNMTGGKITGGEATQNNGGGMFVVSGAKVNISGNAQITGNVGGNLYLKNGATVKVGTMGTDANVGVTLENTTGTFSSNNVAATTGFTSDNTQYAVERNDSKLAIMTAGTGNGDGSGGGTTPDPDPEPIDYNPFHCICGMKSAESLDGQVTSKGECFGDCNGVIIEWMPWTGNTMPTQTGYWYMPENVGTDNALKQPTITSTSNLQIYVDLAGKTLVTGKNQRAWRIDGTEAGYNIKLVVTDSVGGGTVKSSADSASASQGILIWTNSSATKLVNVRFDMYGGHLDASECIATGAGGYAGAMIMGTDATINLYGGKVSGQSANQNNANTRGDGGAFYLASGTNMTMYGDAQIVGGNVARFGGAVYMGANSTLTMNDNSKIIGGNARTSGGSIYFENATVVVKDNAEISGGQVNGNATGSSADVALVSSGTSTAKLTVSGNAKVGYVNCTGTASTVEVADSAKILGLTTGGKDCLTVTGALTKDALIRVTDVSTAGAKLATITAEGLTANQIALTANRIQGGNIGGIVDASDNTIVRVSATNNHCVCGAMVNGEFLLADKHADGCNNESVTWTVYDGQTTTGYYYLTTNYSQGQKSITQSNTVVIDLNGYNITRSGSAGRVFASTATGTKLWLCNTAPEMEGTGIVSANSPDQGGVIWFNAGSEFRLFDNVTVQYAGTSATYGGAVHCGGTAAFNMYGGKLIGTTVTNTTYGGGTVALTGSNAFTMYGGTIIGGSAPKGGAVYVGSSASFTMYGGEIVGGRATMGTGLGGAVYAAGPFTMDGTAAVAAGGTGPVITDGVADVAGGNVYITSANGNFQLKEGTIKNGTAGTADTTTVTNGGNVYMNQGSATMYSGSITGGKNLGTHADSHGGNLYIKTGMTFDMQGGSITGGETQNGFAGNVSVPSGATFKISGTASVTGGKSTRNAMTDDIFNMGTTTMNGGHIGKILISSGSLKVQGNAIVDAGNFFGGKIAFDAQLGENASINVASANVNSIYAECSGMDDTAWQTLIGNVDALRTYNAAKVLQLEADGIYLRDKATEN